MSLLKNQSGFSLIELIVVVSIMGVLSTMAVVNYNSFGKKSAVAIAAQNLASDVRRAQSYALNGKIVGTNEGRWGVYFNENATTSYVVFTDNNQDNLKTDTSENSLMVSLPKNVKILDINPSSSSTVVYIPPDPTILISSSTISSSIIILSDLEGNNQKTIEINIFGLIDIQ